MKLLSHVAAVTRYNGIWLDAQVKLNQNKRLKQQLSIFGIVAASVVLNYNLQYLLFSLLFWFGYRDNHINIVSYESCNTTEIIGSVFCYYFVLLSVTLFKYCPEFCPWQ